MINEYPKFGELFFASLSKEDHVQGGVRPVVIAQNNVGNMHSPTVEIIPMSSRINKAKYMPTHVVIPANQINGLTKDSVALAEQTRIIPTKQLRRRIGVLAHCDLVRIGKARAIQSPFPMS